MHYLDIHHFETSYKELKRHSTNLGNEDQAYIGILYVTAYALELAENCGEMISCVDGSQASELPQTQRTLSCELSNF